MLLPALAKPPLSYLLQKCWQVIAAIRSPAQETELSNLHGVILIRLDVTNLEQINDTVQKALALWPVDVVFNNAGYGLAGPLEGTSDEQLQQEIDTNLLGVLRVTKAFLPSFRERRSGLFITTASIAGLVTFPFNSVYHATKWALEGWSESLAFELNKFGIGVKTISPGGITTDFAGKSLVVANHPAYGPLMEKAQKVFMDPKRRANASTAEQIAEVVYEAATDGKSTLR